MSLLLLESASRFLLESGSSGILLEDPVLAIFALVPTSGDPVGGTAVMITGMEFAGDATVTFDGVPATSVVVVGPTVITCVAPAHALDVVDVVVRNVALATSAVLLSGFAYAAGGSGFSALLLAP
jgi:hypothetical protein